ncbi:hypothetical protein EB796_013027 [Bugula neritina]|uniref:Protein kinase domain-containing protein n=1 Tax=Bugula neritina TaxID=10212 RepID=A0A7J7JRN1_BUGNE|nr:hypothetical protein EB796_013027 [Bugula neritina]
MCIIGKGVKDNQRFSEWVGVPPQQEHAPHGHQTTQHIGTPRYRAPELLHRKAPSKAADMWSMGVTALEALTDNHGNTVLSHVAEHGPMDVLKLCVDIIPPEELYAQVLVTDDDGDTVIHCAAYGNQSEAAVYLLDKLNAIRVGETCVIKNKKGHTPIEYAKSKGYHEFVTVVGAYLRDRKIFLNGKVKHVVMEKWMLTLTTTQALLTVAYHVMVKPV